MSNNYTLNFAEKKWRNDAIEDLQLKLKGLNKLIKDGVHDVAYWKKLADEHKEAIEALRSRG